MSRSFAMGTGCLRRNVRYKKYVFRHGKCGLALPHVGLLGIFITLFAYINGSFQFTMESSYPTTLVQPDLQPDLLEADGCRNYKLFNHTTPCSSDPCRLGEYVMWSEWKACKSLQLAKRRHQTVPFVALQATYNGSMTDAVPAGTVHTPPFDTTPFDAFILSQRGNLPWSQDSNYTAVLLEFRPLERRLTFSIHNAMDNLPVHWRIQVVGGDIICNATRRLFPVEVEAGKIVLTDIGDRPMEQARISEVMTDISFYQKLLGHTWLFFQYDSVICGKQRHLLKHFIETKRGWWGAPWRSSVWGREPKIGGNGGFSLRTKDFISAILTRFPWKADGRAEDWYFCSAAADIYEELPESLRPATFEEEAIFSSETLFSKTQFGVHQYWKYFSPMSDEAQEMFQNCPEMWGILPSDVVDSEIGWRQLASSLNATHLLVRTETNE